MDKIDYQTEYREAMMTYRSQYTLMTQLLTVFVIANVTVFGFGLKNIQTPEILMLGSIFPILIMITRAKSSQLMLPIIFSAINLEFKSNPKKGGVASTYFKVLYPNKWDELNNILNTEELDDKIVLLKKANSGFKIIFARNNLMVSITCIILAVSQLISPIWIKKIIQIVNT